MRHGKDVLTLDLFAVPQPISSVPGNSNYGVQVSELVSELVSE